MARRDGQSFGDVVRARRTQLGLTQEELAEMIDASQATIARWEGSGGFPGGPNKLRDLARALQIPLSDLMAVLEDRPFEQQPSTREVIEDLRERLDSIEARIQEILVFIRSARG